MKIWSTRKMAQKTYKERLRRPK